MPATLSPGASLPKTRRLGPSKAQLKVHHGIGTEYELRGVRWLKKRKFRIIEEWPGPHNDYYDVIAEKNGTKWIIDVKGGDKPQVKIANLVKMYQTKHVNKVGLLFFRKNEPHFLFELSKMSIAGLQGSLSKGKAVESLAGKKAHRARA